MKVIYSIAALKFQELVREKIFYVAVAIAVLFLGMSAVFGTLTFDEQKRILADFGLAGIEWALLVMGIFIGSYSLPREFERQTCLIVLSRPVNRFDFIVGVYAGILAVLTVLGVSLFLILVTMLNIDIPLLTSVAVLLSVLFKSYVITAICLLLSLVVRPVLGAAAGLTVYLLGHWVEDMHNLATRVKNISLQQFAEVMDFITPNFYRFNWKAFFFLKEGVATSSILWMILHSVIWIVLLLGLASFAFRRKQIV